MPLWGLNPCELVYWFIMLSSNGGFLTFAMYHHRELTHYDETKKKAHDSQTVRAKAENLKLSHGGPSQRQASGTNRPIKALSQGRH